MAMTMGQFLVLADADLSKIWHDEGTPRPLQHQSVFNVGSMDGLYHREAKMAGFGALQEQGEGQALVYDDAIAPITIRYDYVVRALGYKITEKLWKNDRYGETKKLEADLRRSSDDDVESFAFALLNYATTTTVATGFDGLALASTAHTRLDGGATQSNRPTVLEALSLSALQTAVIQFRKWRNDRGRPFTWKPKKLIIPADLEMTAIEILGSELKPGTANNDTNAIRRFGLDYMVCDYLTSTSFWALVGDKHDINLKWRFRPETGSEIDFDTETIKRKVRQAYARGFGEWRGYYQGNT